MQRASSIHLLTLLIPAVLAMTSGISAAQDDELDLPDTTAFAIGSSIPVHSVETLTADEFNELLRDAQVRREAWSRDPIAISLQAIGKELSGSRRNVTVQFDTPEWEPQRPYQWVKVTIEDGGWLDDSAAGERYVVWMVPDHRNRLRVRRILRATLCYRTDQSMFSSEPCP